MAVVLGAKPAAPLQFGHQQVHEIGDRGRQALGHQHEAIAFANVVQFFQPVGHLLRRANDGHDANGGTVPARRLDQGDIFAEIFDRHIDRALNTVA